MKRFLLLLIPITLLLGGCSTEREAYNKAVAGCDMTGYSVIQGEFIPFTNKHWYICHQID